MATTDTRVYGPEPWASCAGEEWTWWDLWCCVIAVKDHHGNLAGLAERLAGRIREGRSSSTLYNRRSDDARLAQILDLTGRLNTAGLTPSDLADATVLGDRKITSRARAKFKPNTNIPEGAYARTPAMRDLPRRRLENRARYGHWHHFPVDPTGFYEQFVPTINRKGWTTERQTSRACRTLDSRLRRLDGPRRSIAEQLWLYRGFYTAAAELADIADDSWGELGQLRTEMWLAYLDIDWRSTGMAPEHYWQDLCELRVWEDYAIDHHHPSAWFRSTTPDEINLVKEILAALATEARTYVLDYQASQADTATTELHRARRSPSRKRSSTQR
jgi:hypothetical protein